MLRHFDTCRNSGFAVLLTCNGAGSCICGILKHKTMNFMEYMILQGVKSIPGKGFPGGRSCRMATEIAPAFPAVTLPIKLVSAKWGKYYRQELLNTFKPRNNQR